MPAHVWKREDEAVELRLFPLHTVLFPGGDIPLNVFEPRYLQLVDECLTASEPFGVVLIREGVEAGGPAVPFDVGTTARIKAVEPSVLGNLSVVATGEQRFRINELHRDRAYLWADVEYPEDVPAEAPLELLQRAGKLLQELLQLRQTARGEYARVLELPPDAGALADAIGAARVAAPPELQAVLETLDVRQRLDAATELLETAVEITRRHTRDSARQRWAGPGRLN